MSEPIFDQEPAKKPRHRHSPFQLVALNEVYEQTEHPSLEVREELAQRLGMKIKTVNSWYQNKRASTKKRQRGGASASALEPFYKTGSLEAHHNDYATADSPPAYKQQTPDERWDSNMSVDTPRSRHHVEYTRSNIDDNGPYATLPPASRHPSLPIASSYPPSLPMESYSSHNVGDASHSRQRLTPRRDTTPYSSQQPSSSVARGSSRTRPNSHQLVALKENYARNSNPSLEERSAIANELGMELLKVTNWYRNARQTNRNRVKREYYDSGSASPRGTSSNRSSSLPPPSRGSDERRRQRLHVSQNGHSSEEEMQEAVTPGSTPSPSIMSPSSSINKALPTKPSPPMPATPPYPHNKENGHGATLDEANLLLGFYRHQI